MTDTAHTSEAIDPYKTLETILKVINRSWLTEEWRLEDVRLLALAAISRGEKPLHPEHAEGCSCLLCGVPVLGQE